MLGVGMVMTSNAQISRSTTDSKVAEFSKLVSVYTSGQRVDQNKLTSLYNEINCMLIDVQAESMSSEILNNREEICGSSEFPRTQSLSDATFKRYAESVSKYLSYKK